MGYIIGILVVLLIVLILYIIYAQSQIRSMSRQLDKRLRENTRQPISLELMNSDLSKLAINMNKCLKAEENLRLNGIRDEKKFRELIADISHDLRTPLTAIKGYQQLLDTQELMKEQRTKLHIAEKHADELGQLIEHFFEYSYLLNSEPELKPERINLTQLLTDCLISFITTFEEHKLAVNFDEATPQIYAMADKEMINRILQNLIRNCIQHSIGDITVKLSQQDKAVISFQNPVKDPQVIDLNQLFDRFYTGDKARSHSTGLGLAIVKLLSEQMGGSVGASIEGNKLEIRVELP
jgi:signal transduction histidine kinase